MTLKYFEEKNETIDTQLAIITNNKHMKTFSFNSEEASLIIQITYTVTVTMNSV